MGGTDDAATVKPVRAVLHAVCCDCIVNERNDTSEEHLPPPVILGEGVLLFHVGQRGEVEEEGLLAFQEGGYTGPRRPVRQGAVLRPVLVLQQRAVVVLFPLNLPPGEVPDAFRPRLAVDLQGKAVVKQRREHLARDIVHQRRGRLPLRTAYLRLVEVAVGPDEEARLCILWIRVALRGEVAALIVGAQELLTALDVLLLLVLLCCAPCVPHGEAAKRKETRLPFLRAVSPHEILRRLRPPVLVQGVSSHERPVPHPVLHQTRAEPQASESDGHPRHFARPGFPQLLHLHREFQPVRCELLPVGAVHEVRWARGEVAEVPEGLAVHCVVAHRVVVLVPRLRDKVVVELPDRTPLFHHMFPLDVVQERSHEHHIGIKQCKYPFPWLSLRQPVHCCGGAVDGTVGREVGRHLVSPNLRSMILGKLALPCHVISMCVFGIPRGEEVAFLVSTVVEESALDILEAQLPALLGVRCFVLRDKVSFVPHPSLLGACSRTRRDRPAHPRAEEDECTRVIDH
eukprot:Sspe_Gene.16469::Locus_5811_Transcript_1_1_Confidence_1.000_Length_1715::g.16469::m.16469